MKKIKAYAAIGVFMLIIIPFIPLLLLGSEEQIERFSDRISASPLKHLLECFFKNK